VFYTVQVLHAQGKISRSDVWVKESESLEVPLMSAQLPSLETCQLSLKIFVCFGALITGLLVSFLWRTVCSIGTR
jgi:hypothetical protein